MLQVREQILELPLARLTALLYGICVDVRSDGRGSCQTRLCYYGEASAIPSWVVFGFSEDPIESLVSAVQSAILVGLVTYDRCLSAGITLADRPVEEIVQIID